MPRKNIYFKDKIDREIEDILEIERQKGASNAENNYSSVVNELVRLGLMVYKSKDETNSFDLEGFRRDVIRKVSGSREGVLLLTALITEMYVLMKGPGYSKTVDELLDSHISAINSAEDEAESHHFVIDED